MFRASYNSRKKLSAVVSHLYLPFEQTAVIEFKKNTRFNNLALKDICYYENTTSNIKGWRIPTSTKHWTTKSFRVDREEQVKTVMLTVWKRMKGHTWEGLRNKSRSFSYLLNSGYCVPVTFPRTGNRALNKTGEMTVFIELAHYLEEWGRGGG